MNTRNESAGGSSSSIHVGGPYAWFVVSVLCLAAILGYVDRQIINLLVDPIRADLGINDTQIGLLQALPFAWPSAVLAVPVAPLAALGQRTTGSLAGCTAWTGATFSSRLATSLRRIFSARTQPRVRDGHSSP